MDPAGFQSLTFMAAPAVLCNASALLAMGASNRFGRAVDRARSLAQLLEKPGVLQSEEGKIRLRQFKRTQQRTLLLLRALGAFYLSLGSLAAATIVALVGFAVGPLQAHRSSNIVALVAVVCGATGLLGLSLGCLFLVRETRLAVVSIAEEDQLIRGRIAALEQSRQ